MTEQTSSNPVPEYTKNIAEKRSSSSFLIGASIAAFVAALSLLPYLFTTTYGYLGIGPSMMDYVRGVETGVSEAAAEALFVITTRYILVFGLAWAPISLILRFIRGH